MKRKFKNNILFQPVKIESCSALFSSLLKSAFYLYKGGFDEAALSVMDAGAALGIEKTENRLAWELVNRSVVQAIADLIEENQSSFTETNEETFIENIKKLKYDKEIKVDDAFFNNPKESTFVKDIQDILVVWLKEAKIEKHKSEAIATRFQSFFVYALNDEWAKNSKKYEQLLISMETPFSGQAVMEDDWEKYGAYLNKQTNESIFGEAFSLSQIYISLCAYYKENNKDKEIEEKRIVVDLDHAIREWLNKNDKDDSVRIISGGPGSGKSSFAKMFAADIINTHKVLFVPLHLLNLDNDIEESINRFFISNKFFENTPIGKEDKLLIIFDGLDELSMQGKIGAEAAQNFIRQVEHLLVTHNYQKHQINIIITGRDLPVNEIEALFLKDGQILHVLPYYVEGRREYLDKDNLLNEDKRNLWWEKYGKLTGENYKVLPKELSSDILTDITAQPLLNYLLALSYDRKKIKFSENTNRNDLYCDLINAVYERGWQGKHRAVKYIDKASFELILEEIAVSAWQGAGRTTTVEAITKRCEESKLGNVLTGFKESAEKGVLNLLTAFYFRQSGKTREGDKTFEFTHKSFGEYLTARRIVRQLQKTKDALDMQETKGYGWTQDVALINWIELCSNVPLDVDIHKFLCDEVLRYEQSEVESWQGMLCELISSMLKSGMPFEKISPRPTYHEETWQSRNAEEALLAALSACSRFTKKISKIKWMEEKSAGEWLSKLCGQRYWSFVFAYSCLNNIDFSKCALMSKNFFQANFSGSDLYMAHLSRVDLSRTNLRGVRLSEVELVQANLKDVDLSGVDLGKADLTGADLRGADLTDADLRGADLTGADLRGVDLREADLTGADLREADLRGVDLRGVDLTGTIFRRGDLDENDMQRAIAQGAIIKEPKEL